MVDTKKKLKLSSSAKKRAKRKSAPKNRRQSQKFAGSCFVLMPFKEPFDTYFAEMIDPAVRAAHLEPLRGDSLFRPSPIMGDIWQMIQDARVLVAELTEKNANVFYELGLAHAIGKPVILISETIDDVPFDLQPLRVILYNKSDPAWGARLKGDLIVSLRETLDDVANAVPPMFRKVVKSQAPEDSDLALRLSELERRVSSIGAIRPEISSESPISPRPIVDWESVSRNLQGIKKTDTVPPKRFKSREHAVAWAIANMKRLPLSVIRRRLHSALGSLEGGRVFDIAVLGGDLPKTKISSLKRSRVSKG